MPAGLVRLHCFVAAAATNMYSGLVKLPQTPLLFKHAYWLCDGQDGCLLDRCHSINMPADLLPLNQYACRSFTTQSICLPIFYHSISMPADLLPLIPAWLLLLCISFCYTCVYGCLTISRACWCGASL